MTVRDRVSNKRDKRRDRPVSKYPMLRLTLISRDYCHLCHDMEVAVVPLAQQFGAEIEILDVDADAVLEVKYGEIVPVLLHNGIELSRFVLDVGKLRDYLGKIG